MNGTINKGEVNLTGAAEFVPGAVGVPEPATWTLMLIGIVGLGFADYRRKRVLHI